MPATALEQTITIVNNSGKIIKTGKNLYSIFKDAQGNYKDKKNEIRNERNLQRSQTSYEQPHAQPAYDDQYAQYAQYANYDRPRRAIDAGSNHGSQRSRRSRSVASRRDDYDARSRHALTEGNLKTYTEVSATAPSRPPVSRAFVNPYADMELAKRDMNHHHAMTVHQPGILVPRSHSAEMLVEVKKPKKPIDMDLAYGSIPPDLEYRTDLDPRGNYEEKEATSLIHRIERLLDEAKCMHHSATTTIDQLQKDPDKAAAVALSLGELSNIVKKTSPAFLGIMKSASPAVFGLLSSPQFLIGTTAVLGVTAVCFGGWKIVKRVREQDQMRQAALAYEPQPMERALPPARAPTEYSQGIDEGIDEALIIDDDLSSIDTWRRGIVPFGEDESADMELITPAAERVNKEMYKDDFDTKSRRSTRTSKTHESHRSHRSHRSERSERSHRSHRSERDDSDRRSHRSSKTESVADSERSHRSKKKEKVDLKPLDDGKSDSLVIRPKSHRQTNNMLKALFKPKKERSLVLA